MFPQPTDAARPAGSSPLAIHTFMTRDPVTVRAGTPLPECAVVLAEHGFRHLPVVEGGALVGVVMDADVFARGWMMGRTWVPHDDGDRWLQARQVMRHVDVVARPDQLVHDVLTRLLGTVQDLAIVVDARNHPVGIFTEHDGVQLAAAVLSDQLAVPRRPGPPVTIDVQAPAVEARKIMFANQMRHLLVVDGERLYGVLSLRDLTLDGEIDASVSTRELVGTGEVHFATESVTLAHAAQVMTNHKIGCLPVVDAAQRPRMALTRTDVIRRLAETLDHAQTH